MNKLVLDGGNSFKGNIINVFNSKKILKSIYLTFLKVLNCLLSLRPDVFNCSKSEQRAGVSLR